MAEEKSLIPTVQADETAEEVQQLLFYGDISGLTKPQQNRYLYLLAKSLGLNPWTKPFDMILNSRGQLIVYANKGAAAQIRDTRHISVRLIYSGPLRMGKQEILDIYEVEYEGTMPDPLAVDGQRTGRGVGTVSIKELVGEALANAVMKTHTKAERRMTLALSGVGFPDETETDGMGFQRQETSEPQRRRPRQVEQGQFPAAVGASTTTTTTPTVTPDTAIVGGEKVNTKTGEIIEAEVVKQETMPPVLQPPPQPQVAATPQSALPTRSKFPPAVAPIGRK